MPVPFRHRARRSGRSVRSYWEWQIAVSRERETGYDAQDYVVLAVRRVHRDGSTVGGVLLRRRRHARAMVDTPDKLHALAPIAAGLVTLASFPAVILALVAAPRAGGVDLPPAADARLQLWGIAACVVVAAVGLGCWYGPGVAVRAVATDRLIATTLALTVALAAASPLMIFHHVESRAAWLAMAAAQFGWPFAGLIVCGVVSGRRRKRLQRSATVTVGNGTTASHASAEPPAWTKALPADRAQRRCDQWDQR
jgi:hypothetical protein